MNIVKLEFSAHLENVTFIRGAVASFLVEENLTMSIINEVKTICSEAVTNAIVHGYKNNGSNFVFMTLELEDSVLTITIKDNGVGIEDVEKAREPLFTTKLQEERAGLGFTIMDIFSDDLDVISKPGEGTTVICKKNLKNINE